MVEISTVYESAEERRRVVARVSRLFSQERFAIRVSDLQALFQEVEDPFAVFGSDGVASSSDPGRFVRLFEAIVELWNFTERADLDGATPVDRYRRRAESEGPRRGLAQECRLFLTPDNLMRFSRVRPSSE